MPQFQILPANPSFGNQLGQALGEGVGSGIGGALSGYFQSKKNTSSAEGLADRFGLKDEQRSSFIKTMSKIAPEKQIPHIQKLAEAEILMNYLQQSGGGPGGQPMGGQPSPTSQNQPVSQVTGKPIPAPPNARPIPAIGGLKDISAQQATQHEKQRSYETGLSNKVLEQSREMAQGIPERRTALNVSRQAINSGEMKPLGGDFWADILHIPALRSVSGSALNTAAKTNLIGTLTRVSGRAPNQYLETQINNAFARAGQSKESNLAQVDIAEAILDMDEKYTQAIDRLSQEYREAGWDYIPSSIDREARESVQAYNQERQKELAYSLQENIEAGMGPEKRSHVKHVAPGTPLTNEMAIFLKGKVGGDEAKAIQLAEKLGYEIPDQSLIEKKYGPLE